MRAVRRALLRCGIDFQMAATSSESAITIEIAAGAEVLMSHLEWIVDGGLGFVGGESLSDGREQRVDRPQLAVNAEEQQGRQADGRDDESDLERWRGERVDQPVMPGGNQGASHQPVDPIDRRGLVVDGELPAGILDVGEDDQAWRLERDVENGLLRRWVCDLDLLGGRRLSVREARGSTRSCRRWRPMRSGAGQGHLGRRRARTGHSA